MLDEYRRTRVLSSVPDHWISDEFTQETPSDAVNPDSRRTRKRSGKPSKAAKAAQMRRWRAKHRAHVRAYDRARYATKAMVKHAGGELSEKLSQALKFQYDKGGGDIHGFDAAVPIDLSESASFLKAGA